MWYSIDRENLKFMHKHERLEAVQLLSYLEAPYCACTITSFGSIGAMQKYTVFELHKLYTNTTGERWKGFQEDKLRKDIAAVADALKATDCDLTELRKQIDSVKKGDVQAYRYVRGASKPAAFEGGLDALVIDCADELATLTEAFSYRGDPDVGASIDHRSDDAQHARVTQRKSTMNTQQRRAAVLATITRPESGIGAEIWSILDENEAMRDGIAIQTMAKEKGWQTLTAILQLSQWKKFNGK